MEYFLVALLFWFIGYLSGLYLPNPSSDSAMFWRSEWHDALRRAESAESNYEDVQQKRNELTEQVASLMQERDDAMQRAESAERDCEGLRKKRDALDLQVVALVEQRSKLLQKINLYHRVAKRLIRKRRACLQWVSVVAHRGMEIQRGRM